MYLPAAGILDIVEALERQERTPRDVALVLLAEEEAPDLGSLVAELNKRGIRFFGGVFPGVIHGRRKYMKGAVVELLPTLGDPFVIRGLHTDDFEIPDFRPALPKGSEIRYTAIILLDGLTSNIQLFLSEMFNRLGNSVHYFGGGAGSLSFSREPCIVTSEGALRDAAIVTFVELESRLGVRHGWKRITGPLVATKTRDNVIVELNWRHAFDVYREIVERDSGGELTPSSFFSVAKAYPFGIYREGDEDVVRDPIAVTEEGELVCVGEVPENTVLNVLKGEKASIVRAAGQAGEDCGGGEGRARFGLIADCISRVLFLGDDFDEELAAVSSCLDREGVVPQGVLTLGEISSYGEGFIEFFNKTIVAGVLHE